MSPLGLLTIDKHWNVLTSVVSAWPSWVAAVVSREDKDVIVLHQFHHFVDASIEVLKRSGVTRHITAVAISRVEINKVGEDDGVIARRFDLLKCRFKSAGMPVAFTFW